MNRFSLSTQAIGRIHRYGQVKTAKIVHLLTHETKDVPIYANMNDLAENDVRGLIAKRKEIVPPKRERTGDYVPRKKKESKKASPKKQKKAASDDEEEEEDDDAVEDYGDPDSDHSPIARKPAAKRATNAKKPAGRDGKKAQSIVISDDESEGEMSAESSDEEEEPELSDDEESSEDERPKKVSLPPPLPFHFNRRLRLTHEVCANRRRQLRPRRSRRTTTLPARTRMSQPPLRRLADCRAGPLPPPRSRSSSTRRRRRAKTTKRRRSRPPNRRLRFRPARPRARLPRLRSGLIPLSGTCDPSTDMLALIAGLEEAACHRRLGR